MSKLIEVLLIAIIPILVGVFAPPLEMLSDEDERAGRSSSQETLAALDDTDIDDSDPA